MKLYKGIDYTCMSCKAKEVENKRYVWCIECIENHKVKHPENDTLLCTHGGCMSIQAEEGEFCKKH